MNVFISYRHSEALAGMANLVHDRLAGHFGKSGVFLDSGALAPGDPFPEVIEQRLKACKVCLAMIDPYWIDSIGRLDDPHDWVRHELDVALKRRDARQIRIIPVLLQGASMPDRARLPEPLRALADLQATTLHSASLDDDIASLVQRIERWTPEMLLQWLHARRDAGMLVAFGLVIVFSASVLALFDLLYLDTQLEALTLAWAEAWDDRAPHDKLVTVLIDQSTETALGRPFDKSWRPEHARLIRILSEAGAAVIAFDISLDPPPTLGEDKPLMEAIQAARRSGQTVIFGSHNLAGVAVQTAAEAQADLGLLCIGAELERARLVPLLVRRLQDGSASAMRYEYLPSLGVRAVVPEAVGYHFDPGDPMVVINGAGSQLLKKLAVSRMHKASHVRDCAAMRDGDDVAQMIVGFTSKPRLPRPIRYQDILKPDFARAGAAAVKDKIVLVGVALQRGGKWDDQYSVLRGLHTENRFGYEIQADVINTLLEGARIHPLERLPQLIVMLAMGTLGLTLRFWRRLWQAPRGACVCGAVLLVYLAVSVWLCAEAHLLLNGVYHVSAFLFAYGVSGKILRRRGLLNPAGA